MGLTNSYYFFYKVKNSYYEKRREFYYANVIRMELVKHYIHLYACKNIHNVFEHSMTTCDVHNRHQLNYVLMLLFVSDNLFQYNIILSDFDNESTCSDDVPRARKKARTAFNGEQLKELEKRYKSQKYLTASDRTQLAKSLKLKEQQVLQPAYI